MPIEIVCKIKFAEEDAKPKEKEAGDEQSLLGAARGPAAPRDLATFASTSTLHGLGRACGPGPHGLRRTLWALALLTSLAAFLYQAASLARGYLTRPHLVVMDPAAPAPVAGFPAVTLCNINRFRHSALSDADIFHLANLTGLPPKDRDGHRAAGLRYPEPDMVDILNRTGHQLADMLKSCNFSGHHCSASNFSVVYTRYGKCYTFNADPQTSLPSRAGGMGSGLEIMLDIQQEEYLPIWRETNETSFEAGIRVQIHSQEEPPYIHQLGFGVSPGFQTFVSCQEQRLTYLPQPWGNCRAESGLREPELQGYSAYSVSACRLRCEKEAVLQRCHCRMVHMPGNETICPPNIYIECADHTLGPCCLLPSEPLYPHPPHLPSLHLSVHLPLHHLDSPPSSFFLGGGVSSWGLSLIPYFQGSEDLCRCGTWESGGNSGGGGEGAWQRTRDLEGRAGLLILVQQMSLPLWERDRTCPLVWGKRHCWLPVWIRQPHLSIGLACSTLHSFIHSFILQMFTACAGAGGKSGNKSPRGASCLAGLWMGITVQHVSPCVGGAQGSDRTPGKACGPTCQQGGFPEEVS
uniref:Acid sensing ion channel subunit family member 4 n=1 Tax=Sus scrofa TaxID=9823 RepID=A0A8D0YUE4_PIG